MSNRSCVSKRAHAANARTRQHRRLLHRERAPYAEKRTTHVRVERAQLRIRRRLACTQPERQLQQPRHPRRGLGVADVRLDAAHRQRRG